MENTRKKKSNKGSFTVELTILFTFILFVLFAFIFGIMALYQNMFLQKAVNSAVLYTTEAQGFVGSIVDDNSAIEAKMQQELERQLSQSIFGTADFEIITAQKSENRKNMLEITVKQSVDVPFGSLIQFFSGSDKLTLSASTSAVMDNTVQIMRNTDVAIELATRARISEKLNEVFSIVQGKIAYLLQ